MRAPPLSSDAPWPRTRFSLRRYLSLRPPLAHERRSAIGRAASSPLSSKRRATLPFSWATRIQAPIPAFLPHDDARLASYEGVLPGFRARLLLTPAAPRLDALIAPSAARGRMRIGEGWGWLFVGVGPLARRIGRDRLRGHKRSGVARASAKPAYGQAWLAFRAASGWDRYGALVRLPRPGAQPTAGSHPRARATIPARA